MSPSILIYSKPGCLYCDKVKLFFQNLKIEYKELKLDPVDNNYTINRDILFQHYKHFSFPIIIIGDKFIGGYSELINIYNTMDLHLLLKQELGIQLQIDEDF